MAIHTDTIAGADFDTVALDDPEFLRQLVQRLVRALCMEQSEAWGSGRSSVSMGQSVEAPGAAPGRGSPLSGAFR